MLLRSGLVRALLLALAVASASLFTPPASADSSALSGASAAQVTVYSAKWCTACRSLEAGLRERGIAFETVDVDENPGAFAIAKKAAGKSVVPLTNVVRGPSHRWIVGADVEAVARACEGD